MGKQLKVQARGKGSPTYRAHSFRWKADVKYRTYDQLEKSGLLHGKVVDILDCPGHYAPLVKIRYDNDEISYNFAHNKLRLNDQVLAGNNAPIQPGNILPLSSIPEGTSIFNVENNPGDGGKFARTAGTSAKVISSQNNIVLVLLPSSKEVKLNPKCRATIGIIANSGRLEKPFVKAGTRHHAMRARGKLYPNTSGVAMNAVDHPFGSGRGRHIGKPKTVSRFAPPGAKVGSIRARRTGRRKK